MLNVSVTRLSFDDNAICHVLPALWITLCFQIMAAVEQT